MGNSIPSRTTPVAASMQPPLGRRGASAAKALQARAGHIPGLTRAQRCRAAHAAQLLLLICVSVSAAHRGDPSKGSGRCKGKRIAPCKWGECGLAKQDSCGSVLTEKGTIARMLPELGKCCDQQGTVAKRS
eukprot:7376409-Prymnesium_polylepis.7